jgi:hypothetical protein
MSYKYLYSILLIPGLVLVHLSLRGMPAYNDPCLLGIGHNMLEFKSTQNASDTIPDQMSVDVKDLTLIGNHFKEVIEDLEALERMIGELKEKYVILSQLAEKEKEIIEKYQVVLYLYDANSNRKDFNEIHEKLAPGVLDLTTGLFRDYINLSIEERNEQVVELTNCYIELAEAYHIVAQTPEKTQDIEKSYLREVWNPFTFTNMDERIKPVLYNAFKLEVMPYLIKGLEKNTSCSDVAIKVRAMDDLLARMFELRQEDTEVLEKKLRKAKDPEDMLKSIMTPQN